MRSLTFARRGAFAVVVLLVGAHAAPGAPLNFFFEGNITRIHDSLELDESVFIGAPFRGSYTFDPTGAHDSYPDDPNTGNYYFGPPARLWAQIGIYEFATNDLIMFIANDWLSGDFYEPISVTPFEAAGYQWSSMRVLLGDWTGMALNSDALPLGVPDLSDFPNDYFFGMSLPGGDLGIGGMLTSLTPEPGTFALLALGAGVSLARQRKR